MQNSDTTIPHLLRPALALPSSRTTFPATSTSANHPRPPRWDDASLLHPDNSPPTSSLLAFLPCGVLALHARSFTAGTTTSRKRRRGSNTSTTSALVTSSHPVYANPAFAAAFGLADSAAGTVADEEEVGRRVLEKVHPEDRGRVAGMLRMGGCARLDNNNDAVCGEDLEEGGEVNDGLSFNTHRPHFDNDVDKEEPLEDDDLVLVHIVLGLFGDPASDRSLAASIVGTPRETVIGDDASPSCKDTTSVDTATALALASLADVVANEIRRPMAGVAGDLERLRAGVRMRDQVLARAMGAVVETPPETSLPRSSPPRVPTTTLFPRRPQPVSDRCDASALVKRCAQSLRDEAARAGVGLRLSLPLETCWVEAADVDRCARTVVEMTRTAIRAAAAAGDGAGVGVVGGVEPTTTMVVAASAAASTTVATRPRRERAWTCTVAPLTFTCTCSAASSGTGSGTVVPQPAFAACLPATVTLGVEKAVVGGGMMPRRHARSWSGSLGEGSRGWSAAAAGAGGGVWGGVRRTVSPPPALGMGTLGMGMGASGARAEGGGDAFERVAQGAFARRRLGLVVAGGVSSQAR
ncbi:hypothetical protein HDU96_009258 [Phlyctochytrium bullatum]|nr:hypothetical protein HDU96_009258 [Phlyctochytrium bullatum]